MLLVRQLTVGLVVGIALGILASWLFARLPALIAPFAPVASVATAALAFGTADVLDGSGFLSVYLVGLAVGSTPSRYRGQLVAFHEGVAYVAQVALFVVLGLLVFPSQLAHLVVAGLGLTAGLVFVARPVAVWLSLIPFRRFTRQEQALLGWAGLRGAVPIVLATFALSANLQSADTIFNAVFFVVLLSAAVQGTTLARLARMLRLTDRRPAPAAAPLEVPPLGTLDLEAFDVTPDDAIAGAAVREVGLPRGALIAVLVRGADTVTPRGSTLIKPGDRLYVLAPRSMRSVIEDVFARWRRRI
jgi:potassium/hydrogen antiporter